MDKQKIEAKLKAWLEAYPELFFINLTIMAKNNICIHLDGDRSFSLEDCCNINRYLNYHLNHDTEDYTLEVSSKELDDSLKFAKKYSKNCGKTLDIITKEGDLLSSLYKRS